MVELLMNELSAFVMSRLVIGSQLVGELPLGIGRHGAGIVLAQKGAALGVRIGIAR